jgi:hypothetical protein
MRVILVCLVAIASALGAPTPAYAQQAGAATPPAPPRPNLKAIRALRVRFEQEPAVEDVQKAALKFFQVHPDKVLGYRKKAFLKALVPDLEVAFNAEQGANDRKMTDALYRNAFPVKEFEDNQHTTLSLNVRAHWALDRLVFNAEVLDVTSLVGVQEGLLREITSLYFTRRRLMTFLTLSPPQDPGEKITESIRLDEITANINALTGGYFGRELKKRFES